MSTQQVPFLVRILVQILARWVGFVVRHFVFFVVGTALLSVAGLLSIFFTWTPYTPVTDSLPHQHPDRIAWETVSKTCRFSSMVMLRVSCDSAPQQNVRDAVALLREKLVASQGRFFQAIRTDDELHSHSNRNDVRHASSLSELSSGELQSLVDELADAQQVIRRDWTLLSAANGCDWLTGRLLQLQEQSPQEQSLAGEHNQNLQRQRRVESRLMESVVRFCEGIHQAVASPKNDTVSFVSPWQLNIDEISRHSAGVRKGREHATENAATLATQRIGMIRLELSDESPQPAKVNTAGNTTGNAATYFSETTTASFPEKSRHDASLRELRQIVAEVSQIHPEVTIRLIGVPVNAQTTSEVPWRSLGLSFLLMTIALTFFFVAGLGNLRSYFAVFVSTFCSFGIYCGLNAICFHQTTPHSLFLGTVVLLLGLCSGIMLSVSRFTLRRSCHTSCHTSTDAIIVRIFESTGTPLLLGGLIGMSSFLVAILYFRWTSLMPGENGVSFLDSLVGIRRSLFLLAIASTANLAGVFVIFPAMLKTMLKRTGTACNVRESSREHDSGQKPFGLVRHVPVIPVPLNIVMTLALIAGAFYVWSQRNPMSEHWEDTAFLQNEQWDFMPVLAEIPVLSEEQPDETALSSPERIERIDDFPMKKFAGISNIICYNTLSDDDNGMDPQKRAYIERMAPLLQNLPNVCQIPLTSASSLDQSLGKLWHLLSLRLSRLQNTRLQNTSLQNMPPAPSQGEETALAANKATDEYEQCRHACDLLLSIHQILPTLPGNDYNERIDKYQRFAAEDLVTQLARLASLTETTLRQPVFDKPPSGTTPVKTKGPYWIFPADRWSTVSNHNSQTVLDTLLEACRSGDSRQQVKLCGFPVMAKINTAQESEVFLKTIGIVFAAAFLMTCLVFRSTQISSAMFTAALAGLSLSVVAFLSLDISPDRKILLPVAFFPMLLPLLLGVFPCFSENEGGLSAYFSALLICFGTGTVITGCLLFSNQSAIVLSGRISTIGWMCLMIPLLVNVASFARRQETVGFVRDMIFDRECEENRLLFAETESFSGKCVPEETSGELDSSRSEIPESGYASPASQCVCARPKAAAHTACDMPDDSPGFRKQPLSLATREQLEYFRERIVTSRVFDKTEEKPKQTGQETRSIEEPETAHKPTIRAVAEKPHETPDFAVPGEAVPGEHVADEMMNTPAFPNVWSVGTKYRSRNVVSESQATMEHATVSLGKRRIAESNPIRLTSYTSHSKNVNPDILPMPPRHDSVRSERGIYDGDVYDKRNPRKAV
ncbi:MAG: hypothetical protein FWC50_08010 [Planctomycetaceae bacterium]|nr:hypothetical protein [Planctomycetaceae bacterium]